MVHASHILSMLARSFPVRPRRADPHLQPRAAGELNQRVQAEQFRPPLAQVRGPRARDAELFPEFCIAQVRVFEVRDDRLQQFLAQTDVDGQGRYGGFLGVLEPVPILPPTSRLSPCF